MKSSTRSGRVRPCESVYAPPSISSIAARTRSASSTEERRLPSCSTGRKRMPVPNAVPCRSQPSAARRRPS